MSIGVPDIAPNETQRQLLVLRGVFGTNVALGEALGVGESTVSRWVHGHNPPYRRMQEKIASLYEERVRSTDLALPPAKPPAPRTWSLICRRCGDPFEYTDRDARYCERCKALIPNQSGKRGQQYCDWCNKREVELDLKTNKTMDLETFGFRVVPTVEVQEYRRVCQRCVGIVRKSQGSIELLLTIALDLHKMSENQRKPGRFQQASGSPVSLTGLETEGF